MEKRLQTCNIWNLGNNAEAWDIFLSNMKRIYWKFYYFSYPIVQKKTFLRRVCISTRVKIFKKNLEKNIELYI